MKILRALIPVCILGMIVAACGKSPTSPVAGGAARTSTTVGFTFGSGSVLEASNTEAAASDTETTASDTTAIERGGYTIGSGN